MDKVVDVHVMVYKSGHVVLDTDIVSFFFFNDTAPTEIYTLSLPDALPISASGSRAPAARSRRAARAASRAGPACPARRNRDRKSTRLNSSHSQISYAAFCLKKKNNLVGYALTRAASA